LKEEIKLKGAKEEQIILQMGKRDGNYRIYLITMLNIRTVYE